jgi:hypothetical protein
VIFRKIDWIEMPQAIGQKKYRTNFFNIVAVIIDDALLA